MEQDHALEKELIKWEATLYMQLEIGRTNVISGITIGTPGVDTVPVCICYVRDNCSNKHPFSHGS